MKTPSQNIQTHTHRHAVFWPEPLTQIGACRSVRKSCSLSRWSRWSVLRWWTSQPSAPLLTLNSRHTGHTQWSPLTHCHSHKCPPPSLCCCWWWWMVMGDGAAGEDPAAAPSTHQSMPTVLSHWPMDFHLKLIIRRTKALLSGAFKLKCTCWKRKCHLLKSL